MELSKDGVSYILRGKTLPLKISKEADYKTLLESALPEKGMITTRRSIPIVSTKSFIKMVSLLKQSWDLLTPSLLSNINKGLGNAMAESRYICVHFPPYLMHMKSQRQTNRWVFI